MPSKKSDDQKLADRATDLYWRSGQSVNQIAETMDLSKSGLYGMIRPLPAEGTCPDCGEPLVFRNRTARQKTIPSCLRCEYVSEGEAPAVGNSSYAPELRADAETGGKAVEAGDSGSGRAGEAPGRHGWRSNRGVWAAVLLGVAAGLYVTRRSR